MLLVWGEDLGAGPALLSAAPVPGLQPSSSHRLGRVLVGSSLGSAWLCFYIWLTFTLGSLGFFSVKWGS